MYVHGASFVRPVPTLLVREAGGAVVATPSRTGRGTARWRVDPSSVRRSTGVAVSVSLCRGVIAVAEQPGVFVLLPRICVVAVGDLALLQRAASYDRVTSTASAEDRVSRGR
jgi:hypothetical protein